MLHVLISIACIIFIWKSYKQWSLDRAARKVLEPYGGLADGIEKKP